MEELNLKIKNKMKTMQQVTLTQRINYTKFNLGYATVDDVVKIIKEGNILINDYRYGQYIIKQAVEYIRSLKTKAERQEWKARLLPAVPIMVCSRKWKGIILRNIQTLRPWTLTIFTTMTKCTIYGEGL